MIVGIGARTEGSRGRGGGWGAGAAGHVNAPLCYGYVCCGRRLTKGISVEVSLWCRLNSAYCRYIEYPHD